jgi:N,N-dimethylformamidase
MTANSSTPAKRRQFLKNTAVGATGAAALAAPMISTAQTTTFRFQSTWPARDIFHEYANDFAKKVNDMAGGRLKIEVLPSGSVVPAFQLLDAVNKGTLDGGHGVLAYHYGKSNALALWGSGPAFGMDPNMALAWWDGALNRGIFTLSDVVGGHDLQLINVPTRNVPGRWWSGDIHDPRLAPWQYAAVHFHSDDQDDQQWQPIAEVVLPKELESDVYGIQLMLASGNTDVVPFAVRRAPSKSRARIGVLLPTLTYLAYALEHAAPAGLVEHANETAAPFARANGFHSWYDLHEDGSFVTFCSLRRPLLGMRPDHRFRYTGAEHGLSADLRLLGWLRRHGFDYEVFTDHDLDERRAAALDGLACVVTGAHPEYWSARMLDGLEAYLQQGGNLCYLGGNGFVWSVVVDHSNGRAEMRRGDVDERPWDAQVGASHFQLTDGRSGLWQACGRPSARITGVTAAAMGFGPGVPFLATEGASDPSVSRLFDGIDLAQPLGTTSAVLGAGASYETDLANVSLGTPPNAIVIATAALPNGYVPFAPAFHRAASGEDGTSRLRADMVFFQTPAGGRVFGAGSIGWAGCLNADDEDSAAARLTTNLLQWFSEAS